MEYREINIHIETDEEGNTHIDAPEFGEMLGKAIIEEMIEDLKKKGIDNPTKQDLMHELQKRRNRRNGR